MRAASTIALLILAACAKPETVSLQRQELFTLDIGRLEDQIALYDVESDRGLRRVGMALKDGFIYIADGKGAKVVRYSSWGDLLFMIYNSETTPPPLTLKPLDGDGLAARWVAEYPFLEPGRIAVDSRKHLYVQDRLPQDRRSVDPETKALLDSVILHFDGEGRLVDYLGQDGAGGAPFPQVEGIYACLRDEFAVVSRLPTSWNVSWFAPEGTVRYRATVRTGALPAPPEREGVRASVEGIAAPPDSRVLIIKIDYYRDTFDESTKIRTGTEPDSSYLWLMDIETGKWERSVEVPFCEYAYTDNGRRETVKTFYSLLGAAHNGKVFLQAPVEGGYAALILDTSPGGGAPRRGFLPAPPEGLYFNMFALSEEGLLAALFLEEWQARLVWWRTDRLMLGVE